MSTKRQLILSRIETIIGAVTDASGAILFKKVITDKQPPTNLDRFPLPVCYIYSDRETRIMEGIDAVIGSENWEWYVILEVWAIDKDMETILDRVHSAMYADYNFNNQAEWSERMGVDFTVVDPNQRIESMLIPYRIVYRHILGTM